MQDLEMKIKRVKEGNSHIFNDWNEHTGMTEETFIEMLKWLEEDPMTGGKLRREAALKPDGTWTKLKRCYYDDGDFAGFYVEETGYFFGGYNFKRPAQNETELKYFSDKDGMIEQMQKIGLSKNDDIYRTPVNLEHVEASRNRSWFSDMMARAGLNKNKLAEATGISYPRIHQITKDPQTLKSVKFENVEKISEALHVSIEEIQKHLDKGE